MVDDNFYLTSYWIYILRIATSVLEIGLWKTKKHKKIPTMKHWQVLNSDRPCISQNSILLKNTVLNDWHHHMHRNKETDPHPIIIMFTNNVEFIFQYV